MEYFDIIDENDIVIGKEERDIVHKKHLLHRSILVILANSKNEIFLQLRKSTKK